MLRSSVTLTRLNDQAVSLRGRHNTLFSLYRLIRLQKPTTRLLGPRYVRSQKRIQVDVTYQCNVRCFNCDRSCGQAPSDERMTVEQIRRFVQETVDRDLEWERIRILGGEPTLHPDILEMADILLEYKNRHSRNTCVQLSTNGFGEIVNNTLSRVPKEIEVINSSKDSNVHLFHPFNVAPQDSKLYKYADYSNGCFRTSDVGMGLTPYGYYPCAIAGGIDRVFGFDVGRKEMPSPDDSMVDLLQVFCRLCGFFSYGRKLVRGEAMSSTWRAAYERYGRSKPDMSSY